MATRRNVPLSTTPSNSPFEKTISPSQGGPPSSTLVSDTRPAVSSDVIFKLLVCTASMVVVPLGSYWVSLNFLFKGNSTYSGAIAALMANVVLIVYIVLAMKEDDQGGNQSRGPPPTGVDVLKRQVESKKGQ